MTRSWRLRVSDNRVALHLVGYSVLGAVLGIQLWIHSDHKGGLDRPEDGASSPQPAIALQTGSTPGHNEAVRFPWHLHLQKLERALATKDVSAAEVAWQEAYLEAIGSRRWEGLIEVGDAYLRIAELTGGRRNAQSKARRLYLAALFRARNQESWDGIARATEAFAVLGDREMAEQGIRMAERLAAQGREAEPSDRVREFKERLATRFRWGKGAAFDP